MYMCVRVCVSICVYMYVCVSVCLCLCLCGCVWGCFCECVGEHICAYEKDYFSCCVSSFVLVIELPQLRYGWI